MKRILIAAFLISAAAAVFGQEHTENKSDQALRGSGRVNPSTLAMEISIPLGSYSGRGINVPISLSYSSKLWRMNYIYDTEGGVITGGCRSVNEAIYSENAASGWTTSLAVPYIDYTGRNNLFNDRGLPWGIDTCVNAPPNNHWPAYVRRLTIHLPSGETHELRADDTPQVYPPWSACPNPPPGYQCYQEDPSLQANWNRIYYAVDGSNIKYIENSTTNTYRLLMPDGSFYDFAQTQSSGVEGVIRNAVKFTDRNGNFTSYNAATGNWTDTLERSLTAPIGKQAPTSPAVNIYTMPGMTGEYRFHWKQLKGASAAESGLTDFNQNLKYRGPHMHQTTNGNWATRPAGTYLFYSEFEHYVLSGNELFNPVVLTDIELPTGQRYKFSYDILGRIEKISYPTGGEERFIYGGVASLTPAPPNNITDQANFGVLNRKVYPTPGGAFYEWSYSAYGLQPSGYTVATTNPDGTLSERFLHRGPNPCIGCEYGNFGFDSVLIGMPYEERSYDASSPRKLLSQKLTTWTSTAFTPPSTATPAWHPRVSSEESRVYDAAGNGISTTTTFEYEGDLNLTDTPVLMKKSSQYAFVTVGSPLPENPVRVSESTFLINDPAYAGVKSYYIDQNMVGLVTASQVKDGAGTVVSRSETVYDDVTSYPLSTPGTPGQWTPPPWGFRGNPNTVKVWDSTKGLVTNASAYIATHAQFDNYGNQIKAWDAKGNFTTTAFDTTHYAFPVQVTSPVPDPTGQNGSNTAFVTTSTFNTTTGLPLTTTDANGLRTEIEYDAATLRPLNTKTYFGTNQIGSTAETVYHDEPNNYWVKNRAQIDTNIWAESITYFDGLGRAWKTEEVNSKGNIFVEKEFDSDGRVLRVSNPFRAGEPKVWTTNVYDEASRVKEVVLQDGATVKTDYGVSTTGIIGVTKQITDQAGKKRKGISDALGRMVRVIEDPTGQNPLNTDYVFDTLGNLRKTIQGEQNRFFMHDSLGRLLRAKQPEQDVNTELALPQADPVTGHNQWSVGYSYDDNGNIVSTTDARNSSVTATYDNLNRLKVRDYSDTSMPDVSFYYDGKYLNINDQPQTATGSVKGKTTGVKSSVSRTNYTSFDDLGRLLTHQQITDGQTYGTSYTYNLSGGLVSETYPSNRTVNYEINTDGDLSRVWGQEGSAVTTYANAFNYSVSGAVEKLRLGNGKWETAAYNTRLQITQIGLGNGANDTGLLKLEYGYGNNTLNNGNLREQKITVPSAGGSSGFTAIQSYIYDDLNRIQSATETIGGNQTWKQTFIIDRYGNREFDPANTTTIGSCPQTVCNPDISMANNRFSSGQGYGYDQNGNVTLDAENRTFIYDAENHQKEVKDSQNNTIGQYLYDGDGRRVKKISAAETTVFVYNASGQLVAEYSTQIAQTPQVSYLTTDHLGSPRVISNQLGAVTGRKDFTAFGEENFTAQRTSALGYTTPDNLRKGYTGYEKDDESGLDFAQARYYNSTHGRYTSIDPLTASGNIRNPQTFNRYSYVLNSPYKYTDPLGLIPRKAGWWTELKGMDFGGGGPSAPGCSAEFSSCPDSSGTGRFLPERHTNEAAVPPNTEPAPAANANPEDGNGQKAEQPGRPPTPTAEQNAESPTESEQTTQNGDEIVLAPGSVFYTATEVPGQPIPPGLVPTNQTMTDPYVDSRWSIHLEMRIENISDASRTKTDYEYEVSLDGFSIDRDTPRQAAPNDGEALVGTYTVDRKRFGLQGG